MSRLLDARRDYRRKPHVALLSPWAETSAITPCATNSRIVLVAGRIRRKQTKYLSTQKHQIQFRPARTLNHIGGVMDWPILGAGHAVHLSQGERVGEPLPHIALAISDPAVSRGYRVLWWWNDYTSSLRTSAVVGVR
jgi:hypothetical protein